MLAPKLAPDALAPIATERDCRAHEPPETRIKPQPLVRDGKGRDGAKRIRKPPPSADAAFSARCQPGLRILARPQHDAIDAAEALNAIGFHLPLPGCFR